MANGLLLVRQSSNAFETRTGVAQHHIGEIERSRLLAIRPEQISRRKWKITDGPSALLLMDSKTFRTARAGSKPPTLPELQKLPTVEVKGPLEIVPKVADVQRTLDCCGLAAVRSKLPRTLQRTLECKRINGSSSFSLERHSSKTAVDAVRDGFDDHPLVCKIRAKRNTEIIFTNDRGVS